MSDIKADEIFNDLTESMAEYNKEEELVCDECLTELYQCDGCKDYFVEGQKIFCSDDNDYHYCENCI